MSRRVALIGATGSIGRQAIEIVDAHPELELVAAASGSTPIDGLAPLTQVGGDLTELLERAEPDVVLNAVVGFAGLPVTLWALERGVDLALANKESLVAAGDLALAARERGGGRLLPVDSEHSAALQCLEGRAPEQVDSLVLTASGGPFRGRTRDELADVTAGRGACAPDLEHGPEDHDRLRDAREQGPRADRGALPLRAAVRPDRGRRPPDVGRARARPLPRRRRARAPRLPRHARPDLVRAHLPGARGDARSRRSTSRRGSRSSSTRPTWRRSRCSRSPARPASAAAPTRAPSTPRTRSPSRPSSRGGCRSSASPRRSRRRSPRWTAPPRATSTSSSRPTRKRAA